MNLGAVLKREWEETVGDRSDSKGLKCGSHSAAGMERRGHFDGLVLSVVTFSFSRNIGGSLWGLITFDTLKCVMA